MVECSYIALQALIIVHTIIHDHSKTTGQDRGNPEHYVIKWVGS